MSEHFFNIDLPALLVAVLASSLCALLGSFLVLRKQAMMGDTLSHVVLPGLAIAFIITGSMNIYAMLAGALGACLLSVLLIKFLHHTAKIESGASMGIVFTAMFALGIVLLEAGVGSRVHLDAHHALYGALELNYWPNPISLETMPQDIKILGLCGLLALGFVALFYKELKITSFDPLYAATQGIRINLVSSLLMIMVAVATVACFNAVGSILVIALFVCPAATARMLTDDLKSQLHLSVLFGALSAVLGYAAAVFLPFAFGYEHALSASGMIAVAAGAIQLWAMLFTPKYGALCRIVNKACLYFEYSR